ncbi:MAG: DUF362 domain-containing protein [Planctomycetes bacterium]|nr:DUF362 domain-containing protein [Planctomycetota bacterium]MBL7145342.1 DUF362 domain-containing protein [Phycisphaerae bacterium]
MRAKVAVIKTRPETVIEDIDGLVETAGLKDALPLDKPTILKDNISWHMPFLSANTTPWQLDGIIKALGKRGYRNVVCVENRTVVTNPVKGQRLNHYTPVLIENSIPVKSNFNPDHMRWIRYEPKAEMLVLHKVYPKGIYLPDYFFDKNIIHLPTMKCHIYTTMTGAMKNAFGGLLNHKRHYTHSVIHETLVDLLAIQKEIHSGIFALTDGTVAGDGAGPRTMMPVIKNYMLASADSVAVDAVSAKMMGFDPMSIGCIRIAHERGLGVGRLEEIEVVGEDISKINFNFRQCDNFVSRAGKLFWFGPLKSLQTLMFRTPLVYAFIFGSFFYHDYIWWPTVGKRRMKQIEDSGWYKLFQSYNERI